MKFFTIKLCALTSGILLAAAGCGQQDATAYKEKSFEAPAAEINTVTVDVQDRNIEVIQTAEDTVRLEYAESAKEFYEVAVSGNGALSMTCREAKEWKDYVGGKASRSDRTVKLYLPEKGLQDLTLRTTNEDLILPQITVGGKAEFLVNNGNLRLEELGAGSEIKLNAKNGNITGTIKGAYEDYSITSQTKKGKTNLPEIKEQGRISLAVTVNNGDVNLEFTGGE